MSDTEAKSIEDFEGGYCYTQKRSPRWTRITDIEEADGELTISTERISETSVPHSIREGARERYDGRTILLEGNDGE